MDTHYRLKIMSAAQQEMLHPSLRDPIEYRKSGLSLNHIVGCPLNCGYCVRHLFANFESKNPAALMEDELAVKRLISHRFFSPHVTPLQLFNRATDAMLPNVKPHTFRVLKLLDDIGITNHVLVITRWKVSKKDCDVFNSVKNIKLTVLVTLSGIDDERIEPAESEIASNSLKILYQNAVNYRVINYWRPIIPGLNDSSLHMSRARELSNWAHATVFTGLFYRDEISAYYKSSGLPEPYQKTTRRKIFPESLEARILSEFCKGVKVPIFRKTSCAVSYAHKKPDYNGHYGIRELCDICPESQVSRCASAWVIPDVQVVMRMANEMGATSPPVITDRAIIVEGLDEPPRYFMQHALGFQCHDISKPHHLGRHGRAEIGWNES
ncbi:MAG: hypothetical protein WC825_05160 [Gallionellaceae bacterium]|jgi:DNA repair photolyase